MYFPSEEEQRFVLRRLLPEAREQGVTEELRGWAWEWAPMRPVYDVPLAVYELAGKYRGLRARRLPAAGAGAAGAAQPRHARRSGAARPGGRHPDRGQAADLSARPGLSGGARRRGTRVTGRAS